MQHTTAVKALKGASIFTIVMGAAAVLAVITGITQPFTFFFDAMYLPLDGQQSLGSDTELVLAAIAGGIMIGFGVMALQITNHIYTNDPALGGHILRLGLITWYLTDSAASYVAGAWINVLLNTPFLLLFLVPIQLNKTASTAQNA